MTNFARVINDVAVDVSTDPANSFHSDIAAQFEPVPDEVQSGWIRKDGQWSAPAPAPQPGPVPVYPKVTPIEFKLLFTSDERIAIKSSTDLVVQDFYEITNDPRLTHVDLGIKSTQDAIAYMVSINLLTTERAAQILTGTVV